MLGRFAGQVLNTTLGWAILLLFGKVPQNRQLPMLVIVFGSLVWVALIVGVIVPDVGTTLVAATPVSELIDEGTARAAMLVAAVALPLALGVAGIFVVTPQARPKGPIGLAAAVLRGYPFAFALALIMVVLVLVATGRKLRSLSRRWVDAHVPVIVKPGAYEEVLGVLRKTLDAAGLELEARDAGLVISGPPRLLDLVAGRSLGDLVPDRLMLLVGPQLEILVYPSDLAIAGTKELVARARAVIVSRLIDAPAYLTSSAEAQAFEDDLERLGAGASRKRAREQLRHVRALDEQLIRLAVPYEEWEALYRMRLQLERDALVAMGADSQSEEVEGGDRKRGSQVPSRVDLAIAIASVSLIALDLALLIANRRRPQRA